MNYTIPSGRFPETPESLNVGGQLGTVGVVRSANRLSVFPGSRHRIGRDHGALPRPAAEKADTTKPEASRKQR